MLSIYFSCIFFYYVSILTSPLQVYEPNLGIPSVFCNFFLLLLSIRSIKDFNLYFWFLEFHLYHFNFLLSSCLKKSVINCYFISNSKIHQSLSLFLLFLTQLWKLPSTQWRNKHIISLFLSLHTSHTNPQDIQFSHHHQAHVLLFFSREKTTVFCSFSVVIVIVS